MPITLRTSRTLASLTEEAGLGLATITGQADLLVRPDAMTVSPGESESQLVLPELRQSVTSTEFFDTLKGHLVRGDYRVAITTDGPVGFAGQEQDVGFEAHLNATVQAR